MTKLQTLLVSAAIGAASLAAVTSASALTAVTLTATSVLQDYTTTSDSKVTIDYSGITAPSKVVYYGLYGGSFLVTSDTIPVVGSGSVVIPGTVYSGVDVKYQIQPVPEPATWALMLVGFGGVGVAIRRRGAKPVASAA